MNLSYEKRNMSSPDRMRGRVTGGIFDNQRVLMTPEFDDIPHLAVPELESNGKADVIAVPAITDDKYEVIRR